MSSVIHGTDWGKLRHAHGTCGHMPEVFRKLASDDAKVRQEAYWAIDNNVVLQGDLYEAAPTVTLALIELVGDERRSAGRPEIYELLVELAYGNAPPSMTVDFMGEACTLKAATVRALASGVPWYLRDLADGAGDDVRDRILELLSLLKDEDALDVALVRSRMESTTNPELKQSLRALVEG